MLYAEAVSDQTGLTTWYASGGEMGDDPCKGDFCEEMQRDWDASGSIMLPTGHIGFPPWIKFEPRGQIQTIRLDGWLQGHPEIEQVDLLWADIQGAELKMIAGASNLLQRTRFLYLECYDRALMPKRDAPDELYEGQPTLAALRKALPGWTCLGYYNADSVLFRNDG
jgi:FkbM family methyltransferase